METTPNDLRQQQFEIKFRGYNPDDVEVFRDLAASALEEARAEILKLSEENRHLKERLEHLISIENTLKAAVLEAQKNAETTIDNARKEAAQTVANARKEAELILKEAGLRREEVVADMHRQMGKLVADINKIRFIRSNYLARMKALMAAQAELVDEAASEDHDEKISPPDMPRMAETPQPESQPVMSTEVVAEAAPAPEQAPEPEEDEEWKSLREKLDEQ